jgi:hypothetical protein
MELIKFAILIAAVAMTMFSRRWGIAVFAFFLPLTQWLPDTHIPGVNAINLMLLPLIARSIAAGKEPGDRSQMDPILIPGTVIVALVTWSWLRVRLADTLPREFVEAGGIYDNFVT